MGVVIRQKTKGKGQPWWVFISHQGKRTSRKVGSKSAAKTVAGTIEAKLKLGEFDLEQEKAQPDPTFKDYADSWIETTVPATCKRSTVRDYQDLLRLHVLPVFGDMVIATITRGKVKDFLLGKMNEGYAKSTVTHMKNVVSGILNKALDDEAIGANPALNLGKNFLKDNGKGKAIDPLTRSELSWLLRVVEALFPAHYALFLCLARTGMRIGEVLALQWGDIDFRGRFIMVARGFSRGEEETPKSGKARKVDMSRQLAATLKALRHQRKLDTLKHGWGKMPEWIFVNTAGKPIDLHNWRRRVFNKALEKAELRKIRIHDIRHSYATLRISKGDNIADVSGQLGHHSVALTLNVYNHWQPGKKKEEVDGLDDENFMDSSAPYPHPGASGQEKRATGNSVTL